MLLSYRPTLFTSYLLVASPSYRLTLLPVALSGASGDPCQSYDYAIYGQVSAQYPDFTNPYLFTGQRFDRETGLYYYKARYYNPHIGRFMQTDPIGYGDGINWYKYCRNNPGNWMDPSGMWVVWPRDPLVVPPFYVSGVPTYPGTWGWDDYWRYYYNRAATQGAVNLANTGLLDRFRQSKQISDAETAFKKRVVGAMEESWFEDASWLEFVGFWDLPSEVRKLCPDLYNVFPIRYPYCGDTYKYNFETMGLGIRISPLFFLGHGSLHMQVSKVRIGGDESLYILLDFRFSDPFEDAADPGHFFDGCQEFGGYMLGKHIGGRAFGMWGHYQIELTGTASRDGTITIEGINVIIDSSDLEYGEWGGSGW